jgi:hypothetical protein
MEQGMNSEFVPREPPPDLAIMGMNLSKRAARRMIQRAMVLVHRDRQAHQRWREARLATFWSIEDWDMEWSAILDRGRMEFGRRAPKKPDLVFRWRSAEEFFQHVDSGKPPGEGFTLEGPRELWKFSDPLLKSFIKWFFHVCKNPIDDLGESLL